MQTNQASEGAMEPKSGNILLHFERISLRLMNKGKKMMTMIQMRIIFPEFKVNIVIETVGRNSRKGYTMAVLSHVYKVRHTRT